MGREQKRAARGVREQLAKERRRHRILWTSFGIILLLVIAGLISWSIYRSRRPADYALPATVTGDGGRNAGLLVADEGGAIPVEIYFDYLCPACRQFQADNTATLNQLLADKKIKLVWHPVGMLDNQSNPPGYSTRAANATGCAANVNMHKMKAFGEALFTLQPAANGPGFSDDQLIDIAGTIGIITPSFAACVRAVGFKDWLTNVEQQATQRGAAQTPTVYVNGKPVAQPGPATITAAVASAG